MSVAVNRYARALMDVLYPHAAEMGLSQLRQFDAVLAEQPEAGRALMNPAIPGERRKVILSEIASFLGIDPRVSRFLGIIVERKRLQLLGQIVLAYQALLDEKLGIARAKVSAAHPLDPAEEAEIAQKLEAVTGKRVEMEVEVDPTLIGGVVARVGGTIYDGSLRQQLRSFKRRLIEE